MAEENKIELKNHTMRHWLIVLACCGLAASAIGICSNTLGVFYTPVSNDLGVGRGAFAFHATVGSLLTGFMGPVVAKLMKKYPMKLLMAGGIIIAAAATMLMGLAHNLILFYALGLMRGFGCAFFTMMPLTTIISNWFAEKNGLAVGIAMSFSGLSGAVFNPIVSSLITNYGWSTAYFITGICIFALAMPGVIFILRLNPSDCGLLPYGAKSERKADIKVTHKPEKVNFFNLTFISLAAFSTILCLVIGIAQHFSGYTESLGLGLTLGATMTSAGMVGNIISKLVIGVLSDKIGAFRSCQVMTFTNFIGLIGLMLLPKSNVTLLGCAFLYGFIYSITGAGTPLLVRQIYGPQRYAMAYSVVNIVTCIGSAFSLTIVGLIYDFTGSYYGAFTGGAVIDIIAIALLLILMKRLKAGKGI